MSHFFFCLIPNLIAQWAVENAVIKPCWTIYLFSSVVFWYFWYHSEHFECFFGVIKFGSSRFTFDVDCRWTKNSRGYNFYLWNESRDLFTVQFSFWCFVQFAVITFELSKKAKHRTLSIEAFQSNSNSSSLFHSFTFCAAVQHEAWWSKVLYQHTVLVFVYLRWLMTCKINY